jgi:hypothetical protein
MYVHWGSSWDAEVGFGTGVVPLHRYCHRDGLTMSHKNAAHRNVIQESHQSDPGTEVGTGGKSAVAPRSSSGGQEERAVASWQAMFVLSAIGFGLLVLAAKALGLF